MFGSDKRVLLRHYLEQGTSKAAIARQLGVSRRTVYYWIKTGQLNRGGKEEAVQYVIGNRGQSPSLCDDCAFESTVLVTDPVGPPASREGNCPSPARPAGNSPIADLLHWPRFISKFPKGSQRG